MTPQEQAAQRRDYGLMRKYNWFVEHQINQKLPVELRGVNIKELEARVKSANDIRMSALAMVVADRECCRRLLSLWWETSIEDFRRIRHPASALHEKVLALKLPKIGVRAAMDIANIIVLLLEDDTLDRLITAPQGVHDDYKKLIKGRISTYSGQNVKAITKPTFRVFLEWWLEHSPEVASES